MRRLLRFEHKTQPLASRRLFVRRLGINLSAALVILVPSLLLGMAGFVLVGWLMWQWEAHASRRQPACPRAPAALEPTDHL